MIKIIIFCIGFVWYLTFAHIIPVTGRENIEEAIKWALSLSFIVVVLFGTACLCCIILKSIALKI